MPVVRLDPQYDNIRVRRYWALRVPISRPTPLTIFTVIATDTTDEPSPIGDTIIPFAKNTKENTAPRTTIND